MAFDLDGIVEKHITDFNERRLEKIRKLKAQGLLRNKNPYLFIARNTVTVDDLGGALVTATLSSSEETQFGQTLENIAIDICAAVYGGTKSAAQGIDLEFDKDGTRYIVSIKSGPSWGNSSQIAKMKQDFDRAKRVIRQGDPNTVIEAVNGCCYGRTRTESGSYVKLCGSAFWELVSGESDLYRRLIVPIADLARNGFTAEVEAATERIADELRNDWATDGDLLDWAKIVALNAETRRHA